MVTTSIDEQFPDATKSCRGDYEQRCRHSYVSRLRLLRVEKSFYYSLFSLNHTNATWDLHLAPGYKKDLELVSCLLNQSWMWPVWIILTTNPECNQFRYNNHVHTDINKNMPTTGTRVLTQLQHNARRAQPQRTTPPLEFYEIASVKRVAKRRVNGDQRAANTMKKEARCLSDLHHHRQLQESGWDSGTPNIYCSIEHHFILIYHSLCIKHNPQNSAIFVKVYEFRSIW